MLTPSSTFAPLRLRAGDLQRAVLRRAYPLSPRLQAEHRYRLAYGKAPDLKNPTTRDEKLIWLMLYWRHPLKTQCADKYAVRSYVEQNGLGHLLPALYGVYENSREIDFFTLPKSFVLKSTHASRHTLICRDKSTLDRQRASQTLDAWMNTNFGRDHGEVHYIPIKPRIICEEYLDDGVHDQPIDYKVSCFAGKAHCTLVCQGRSQEHCSLLFDYYDRDWKQKLPYSRSSLLADRVVPKPEGYEEMISSAEILSAPFPFVRVDYYSVRGRAYLGEMTFTPSGCVDPGHTELGQRELGAMITLPPPLPAGLARRRLRRRQEQS